MGCKHKPRTRRGFTLVELLVAIAIIGILAALTLSGVMYARESARRSVCANHLHQLGIALTAYHTALSCLPPAVIWEPPGEPLGLGQLPIGVIDRVARYGRLEDDTIYANWALMLLPYLDHSALAERFDPRRPIAHPSNEQVRTAQLAVLKCPSDLHNEQNHYQRGLVAGIGGNEYARGNYAVNAGPDADCVEGTMTPDGPCIMGFIAGGGDLLTKNDSVWGSGVAGVNRSFRFAEIKDGVSNTVVIDEIRAGLAAMDPRGAWALGQVGASITARHGKLSDATGPNPPADSADEFIGCLALAQHLGIEQLRNERMACALSAPDSEINAQAPARSLHRGGVNILFCDGSARFITDSVDIGVWHALHTRDSSEAFGQPE